MFRTTIGAWAALALVTVAAGQPKAALQFAPGSKVVFGDNSELSSAPEPGAEVPVGHGGIGNTVSGTNAYVGGGASNAATGSHSTVSGGRLNTAGGGYASVVGGSSNAASGSYSFAAGRRAKSTANGTFTFADSSNSDFSNTIANSFRVRSTGGFFVFTKLVGGTETFQVNTQGNALLTGVLIAENTSVRPGAEPAARSASTVDARTVLNRLDRVAVGEYVSNAESGPVARFTFAPEAFQAAFGLGDDPEIVSLLDAQAVSFASIQALHAMIKERDERIDQLEAALENLLVRVESLDSGI